MGRRFEASTSPHLDSDGQQANTKFLHVCVNSHLACSQPTQSGARVSGCAGHARLTRAWELLLPIVHRIAPHIALHRTLQPTHMQHIITDASPDSSKGESPTSLTTQFSPCQELASTVSPQPPHRTYSNAPRRSTPMEHRHKLRTHCSGERYILNKTT